MWKFWLFSGFFALCAWSAVCQPLTDEQLLKYRVGSSFDSEELSYFGLFTGSKEKVDSMHYGKVSGSFYIEPYTNGSAQKVLLSSTTQAEFLKYIVSYEKFALDPRNLDLKSLTSFNIKPPLKKHERNGYSCSVVSKSGKSYYGELVYMSTLEIVLFEVDLGYEASLVAENVKIHKIDTLKELKIFRRNVAKYTGLATGLAVGVAMSGAGYSPFKIEGENGAVIANLLAFTALGFGLGVLLDEFVSFKTTYDLSKPDTRVEAILRSQKGLMFPNKLPPELKRILSPTP